MGFFDDISRPFQQAAAPIFNAAQNQARQAAASMGINIDSPQAYAQGFNPITQLRSAYGIVNSAGAAAQNPTQLINNPNALGPNALTAPFAPVKQLDDEAQGRIKAARDEEDAAMARSGQTRQQVMNIRDAQKRMLDQYKRDQPGIRRGLLESSQRGISGELNRANTATKAAAAGRGILRSGIQKQAEAQAKSDAASKYAKSSYDIGNQLDDQLADFEDQYIQTGLDVDSASLENQIAMQRRALEEMERRGKALGQLGQGVGQLGGTYLANREKK